MQGTDSMTLPRVAKETSVSVSSGQADMPCVCVHVPRGSAPLGKGPGSRDLSYSPGESISKLLCRTSGYMG